MDCDNVDNFKSALDSWLENIPDQPTIAGRQRPASSLFFWSQGKYSTISSFMLNSFNFLTAKHVNDLFIKH